jgi:RNA polymerase sigma-70 factor (ECF subfamily)
MTARMQRTDEELYGLMRKGDRRAFAELYERREPGVFRYALHMSGSATAAEEIAQEVFVQLMSANTSLDEKRGFDEKRGSLEAWMYGVARNLVRVFRRKGLIASAHTPEPVEQLFEHDILGDLINSENIAALRAALLELPDNYRDAVVLCDLEERNYDEAARLMGCPVGTVRSRLHRARGLLAARLKRLHPVAQLT